MIVEVQSFIPWLENLNGTYEVENGTAISEFLRRLQIEWDQHVLVGINHRIAQKDDPLAQGDQIVLMIPLTGG